MLRRSRLADMLGSLALGCASACTPSDPAPDEVPTDNEYCAAVVDWPAESSAFELEVLDRVNEARAAGATCGEVVFEPGTPLVMDPSLRCAARVHARDMGVQDYVMHTDPEGVGFHQRAEAAGYPGTALGETLASEFVSPEAIVLAWLGAADYCVHIMNPLATEMGVGFYPTDEATFGTYWVQVFGALDFEPDTESESG